MWHRRALMAGALALLVAGCSGGEDEAVDAEATPETPEDRRVPVETVERLELGQTRTGIALAAFGIAPGIGYGRPTLVARRRGAPGGDGLIDFDFLVSPPDPSLELPTGQRRARTIRGDLLLTGRDLVGARGLRVHGLGNARAITFR